MHQAHLTFLTYLFEKVTFFYLDSLSDSDLIRSFVSL